MQKVNFRVIKQHLWQSCVNVIVSVQFENQEAHYSPHFQIIPGHESKPHVPDQMT